MNDDYERYRQMQIEAGKLYQDFVCNVLYQQHKLIVMQHSSALYQQTRGESTTGIEIKYDKKLKKTERLWIEIAEKARPRSGPYAPSGIYRADNSWLYVIGDYTMICAFQTTILQALHASGRFPIVENYTKTSQGFLLHKDDARKAAAFVLPLTGEHERNAEPIMKLDKLGALLYGEVLRDRRQLRLFEKDGG